MTQASQGASGEQAPRSAGIDSSGAAASVSLGATVVTASPGQLSGVLSVGPLSAAPSARMPSNSRAELSQAGVAAVTAAIGMGLAAQSATARGRADLTDAASEAGTDVAGAADMADAPTGTGPGAQAPLILAAVDGEAQAAGDTASGPQTLAATARAEADIEIDPAAGTFPFTPQNDAPQTRSQVEAVRAGKDAAIAAAIDLEDEALGPQGAPAPSARPMPDDMLGEEYASDTAPDRVTPPAPGPAPDGGTDGSGGGLVGGIVDGIIGEDGLVDDLLGGIIGEDGLLDDLLGEDGLVDDLLDGILGEDGLVDGLLGEDGLVDDLLGGVLDGVLGDGGLVDGLVGEDGLVGGVLDGVLGEDGLVDGLLGGVIGEDGLLGGLTGDDGLLGGVLGDDGVVDGLLGGVVGEDGLLGGLTGDDGLLGGVLGDDGVVDGLLGGVVGEDGLLGGLTGDDGLLGGVLGDDGVVDDLLGGVIGEDGLLGGLTGDDGILGGVLGDDGVVDDLLGGVVGEDGLLGGLTGEDGLLGGVLGDEGLLGGVTGSGGLLGGLLGGGLLGLGRSTPADTATGQADAIPETDTQADPLDALAENTHADQADADATIDEAAPGSDEIFDDGFLETLLLAQEGDALLEGLLGEQDLFDIDVLPAQDGSADELLSGLGGTLVDEGVVGGLAEELATDEEVNMLLNDILGSHVDGDIFSGGQSAFDTLMSLGTPQDADGIFEGALPGGEDDSLFGSSAIDGALNTLFGLGEDTAAAGDALIDGMSETVTDLGGTLTEGVSAGVSDLLSGLGGTGDDDHGA